MPALTIKNIPNEIYIQLKRNADLHRRSLNSEVIVCLESVLRPKRITPDEHIARAEIHRSSIQPGIITPEDIDHAIDEGRS